MDSCLVPVAQYLRMSTEHQQYSMENQAASIRAYAASKGFIVMRTYSDSRKSGVGLKHREGLRQLIRDVIDQKAEYRAVLVYDVSRWGRFQDTDESAHYEFLCKSAGVPIHYCAETFSNDGSLASLIMKALKRTMAGEYSRELGTKVLAGQRRLASLGFKQGGMAGYGLRRLLVTPERDPKQSLAFRERKSIATDRVILTPGPAHEIQVVRQIYRMLMSDGLAIHAIAQQLNRAGVKYSDGKRWSHHTVADVLTNPKYAGFHVYGRTSRRLFTPTITLPKSGWLLIPAAFEPLVDTTTYTAAQVILNRRTGNKTDTDLLNELQDLLTREGRLSLKLIKESPCTSSPSAYRQRFGSLRKAYELIGYGRPRDFGPVDLRRRTQALRQQLISRVLELFPNELRVIRRSGRCRERLKLRNRTISVVVARSVRTWKETRAWVIDPPKSEHKCLTLLGRLDHENRSFLDFHMIPSLGKATRFHIRLNDEWLSHGQKLDSLDRLGEVADGCPSKAARTQ
jgi:DNA invertase Pin-like site-specific DNA recombinase